MTYKIFIGAIIGAAAAAAALSVFLDIPFENESTCAQKRACQPAKVTTAPITS
ncbi:hypothetical protein [Lentibacter sp.]|uniref:hypothetical protein n=1 Tax=Lentibacter sp. TaxID=2024994 RepID=UPI003F6A5D5D